MTLITRVRAAACANIALTKYWGKAGPGNAPATPSISLALSALRTETVVERVRGGRDRVILDGRPADRGTRTRVGAYLDLWREQGLLRGNFRVDSRNLFPTAAGLASSASGYAALAAALSAFSPRRIGRIELSRLARLGSGSAARSVPGGLARLPAGPDPAARRLLPPAAVPFGMVVALAATGEKETGSREGMLASARSSPYYRAWLRQARRDDREMRAALAAGDLPRIGALAEGNMAAMHAVMLATRPALLYWNEVTIRLLGAVRGWRRRGLAAWATVDAGPHVVLLCAREDLPRAARRARRVPGVRGVIESLPGGAAEVIEIEER